MSSSIDKAVSLFPENLLTGEVSVSYLLPSDISLEQYRHSHGVGLRPHRFCLAGPDKWLAVPEERRLRFSKA